jgi:hypothetical protein
MATTAGYWSGPSAESRQAIRGGDPGGIGPYSMHGEGVRMPETIVHVPGASGPMMAEVRLRDPGARLRPYGGSPFDVRRARGDVLVIPCSDTPPGAPRDGIAVGTCDRASRTVLVLTTNLAMVLGAAAGDPRVYAAAVARVVAHEMEHLRRDSRARPARVVHAVRGRGGPPGPLLPRVQVPSGLGAQLPRGAGGGRDPQPLRDRGRAVHSLVRPGRRSPRSMRSPRSRGSGSAPAAPTA